MLRISADPAELDLGVIHNFLARQSYWAQEIPLDIVRRALANSVCYAGFAGSEMVAFARAVTDQATFAYISDVFVMASHRRRGYARELVAALMADSRLQGLRRWMLITHDMQPLYASLGFTELAQPGHMQKHDPDVYRGRSAD